MDKQGLGIAVVDMALAIKSASSKRARFNAIRIMIREEIRILSYKFFSGALLTLVMGYSLYSLAVIFKDYAAQRDDGLVLAVTVYGVAVVLAAVLFYGVLGRRARSERKRSEADSRLPEEMGAWAAELMRGFSDSFKPKAAEFSETPPTSASSAIPSVTL